MAQYNAINPIASSVKKRGTPSFLFYMEAGYLHLETLCNWILGKWIYSRGSHTDKLNMNAANKSCLLCFPLKSLWIVVGQTHPIWMFSIILLKKEAVVFLQSIFLCVSFYVWIFWEMFPSVSKRWFVTSLTVLEWVFNINLSFYFYNRQ